MSLQKDIETAINKHSRENPSNTPDYILAAYLIECLEAYEDAVKGRDDWHDFKPFDQPDGKE